MPLEVTFIPYFQENLPFKKKKKPYGQAELLSGKNH